MNSLQGSLTNRLTKKNETIMSQRKDRIDVKGNVKILRKQQE